MHDWIPDTEAVAPEDCDQLGDECLELVFWVGF